MPEVARGGLPALDYLLDQAVDNGVRAIVGAAVDEASGAQLISWALHNPRLLVALGYHPWYLENLPADYLSKLRRQCQECPSLVAIGEIGLDGSIACSIDKQIPVFIAQLDLAAELGLPAIIHARKASQKVVDILTARPPQPLVLHSFSGSYEQIGSLVARGNVFVSFSGSVTRPSARRLHKLAAALPDETLLLETDAPSINIEGVPQGQARPAGLQLIAKSLAEFRHTEVCQIVAQSEANTARFLGKNYE